MSTSSPALPPGLRIYAIGDIHGRLDLLDILLAQITVDRGSAEKDVQIIFLGDYIDRGLYSRQVIDRLIEIGLKETVRPIFIMGNHEQVMRDLLKSPDEAVLRDWLRFGGRETMMSYGVQPPASKESFSSALTQLAAKMPPAHLAFLAQLQTSATLGDYFFCHAGVRPGIELGRQIDQDLVWIRHEFLGHKKSFGKVVVHGHTIAADVEILPNRIGIDTGAYATGCLSCLALEGTKKWLLQTK